jgi:hypothetical protein
LCFQVNKRIDNLIVDMDFEVDVRSRTESRVSRERDYLAAGHTLTHVHKDLVVMAIVGNRLVIMFKNDKIAVACRAP